MNADEHRRHGKGLQVAVDATPRGSVAPGGASVERDPALDRWRDQAATAAAEIGDGKFDAIAGLIDSVEARGGTLGEVLAELPGWADVVGSDDEGELNRQAVLAGMLRGRFVVAEAAAK